MKKTLTFPSPRGGRHWRQRPNVVSAYNYLQDGDLAKAAEFIEPAISHETTSQKEKTWRYRGDIYRLIALDPQHAALKPHPDAMQKAPPRSGRTMWMRSSTVRWHTTARATWRWP
ncbi:MAG: hypothetical protein IPG74_12680 [Flavobacteriales bacterium]|nr:hypothetical protein [Flavobacteriales bacterium]